MKYIKYEDYLRKIEKLRKFQKEGGILLIRKSKIKIILGVGCLVIAILPNGLLPVFLPLSFYFLGWSMSDLEELKRKIKNKLLKRV